MSVWIADKFSVRVFTLEHDYGVVGQAKSRAGVIRVARQFAKEKLPVGTHVGWEMLIESPGAFDHGRGLYTGEFPNR